MKEKGKSSGKKGTGIPEERNVERTDHPVRASDEKFSAIFGLIPDPTTITDIETGRIVDLNDAAAQWFGRSREDAIGMTTAEVQVWEDPSDRDRMLQELGKRGEINDMALRLRMHTGELRSVLFSSRIMEIEGKRRLLSRAHDITDRKRSEDALKQSEEKYRRLYHETPVLLHSIDRNGVVVEVNDYWLKTMGYERNEVMGRKVADFYTEASRKRSEEVVQPAFFRDGIAKDVSYQFVKKNGEVLDVLIAATAERDASGAVVRSLAVIEDITERKRAEAALRESEERFKAITMTASDAILLMDDRGKIVHWNPAAGRMFGYSAGEALGKDLHQFLAPRRLHNSYLKGFGNFIKTGQGPVVDKSVELAALRKDGTEFPIEVSTSAMNIKGRWHALGIIRDISDRKRAEREKGLLEDERLKTQKLESIGTLAGGIAHDFNNLLQGVFGFISMAKMTFDRREKSLAMLAQAEKALHQAVNLTSQLLTFSKGGKPVKKVHAIRPLLENSVAFALSGSRVTYEITTDGGKGAVEADEGQLGQVIQNIVLNADQAMPLGGMIRVSVRNVPATALVPPPGLSGDLVEIAILDQGAGIPAEHLPRIFDPYFTTKEKGSGLGLATAYSIIKNHGGLLRVQSEPGKGTAFFIYLPASCAVVEEPDSPAIPGPARKGRILVMDDEEMIREVAGELLAAIGHEVAFAETGETALKAYQEAWDEGRPFDAVILDLTIRGGMGGAETLRKLAELDPEVKAVVSSGYSDDAALSNYREQGFRMFLKKPYDIDDLRSTFNELLA